MRDKMLNSTAESFKKELNLQRTDQQHHRRENHYKSLQHRKVYIHLRLTLDEQCIQIQILRKSLHKM